MNNKTIKITPPDDKLEDTPSIWDTGSELDSTFWMKSPDQTSETLYMSVPSEQATPKQNDFPTKAWIGRGKISGSSIWKI